MDEKQNARYYRTLIINMIEMIEDSAILASAYSFIRGILSVKGK